jgi:glycosyltransferase involved in cell wall biosynthesis
MPRKCEKMKYSVLMAVYEKDSPSYLRIALESIYEKQTRKPDEIVVVFDGPLTDELYFVLDEFRLGKENIVFYYPQEKNGGLGEALRVGSEKCTGDYIFRMDSDDISDSERFERQIEYIELHPEVDALGTDIAEFQRSYCENEKRIRVCPASHDGIVRMSKRRNPMNHVTVCMKSSAVKKCGGYKELPLLEDYYLWLRMIASGCVLANLNIPLVYVRIGNGFETKRGSKKRIQGWMVLQRYMLKNKMITILGAMLNMLYIWGFVNTPAKLKEFLYSRFLRK